MVKKILITLLFFMIAIFIIYCDDNLNKSEEEEICKKYGADVLLPSELGNKWEYQIWSDFNDKLDTVTYSITDTLTVEYNGIKYHCFIPHWSNQDEKINWLYCNGQDGLYMIGGFTEEDTLIKPVLQFKYPVNEGETWEVPGMVYHPIAKFIIKDTLTVQCTNINQEYIVPVDTFYTIVYKFNKNIGDDLPEESYYNYYYPSVGIIGNIRQFEEYGIQISGEFKLIDYCLY